MEIDRIADSFREKNVFITGATGFMGKVFIERVLRLTKVKKIFVLIRSKNNVKPEDRLNEIFENPLFDKLKEKMPISRIIERIHLISGDCSYKNLNISQSDRDLIINNVSMIYHFAATLKFTEKFKRAIELNVRGTHELLKIAQECKNLEIFCHISTAFCHLKESILMEKCYEPPANPHEVIYIAESLDDYLVEVELSQYLSDDIPNSYVFTKALSEDLVAEAHRKFNMPIMICRPALVSSMHSDPLSGWTDNLNNINGLVFASCFGILRSLYIQENARIHVTPVDFAISNIMMSTWKYLNTRNKSIFIVNLEYESIKNGKNWPEIIQIAKYNYPLDTTIWYPNMRVISSYMMNYIITLFNQWIPAFIIDMILRLMRKKPFMMISQKRIEKELMIMHKFDHNKWAFDLSNTKKIKESMNEIEKHNYGTSTVESSKYVNDLVLGIRRYTLKQKDENLPNARKRIQRFLFISKIIKTLMLCGVMIYLAKKLCTLVNMD